MPNVIAITDFSAPELDAYARLTERELLHCCEPGEGLFIAESPNVILRALDAGYEPVSLLMERKHIAGQARQVVARCGDIPLFTAELPVLTQLTGFSSRAAYCAPCAAGLFFQSKTSANTHAALPCLRIS